MSENFPPFAPVVTKAHPTPQHTYVTSDPHGPQTHFPFLGPIPAPKTQGHPRLLKPITQMTAFGEASPHPYIASLGVGSTPSPYHSASIRHWHRCCCWPPEPQALVGLAFRNPAHRELPCTHAGACGHSQRVPNRRLAHCYTRQAFSPPSLYLSQFPGPTTGRKKGIRGWAPVVPQGTQQALGIPCTCCRIPLLDPLCQRTPAAALISEGHGWLAHITLCP